MRLQLRIPQVNPGVYYEPEVCPAAGCGARRFKSHQQQGRPKRLLDLQEDSVIARRLRCVRCGRSFRVYPQGVSRSRQSCALKTLSITLYILGLSYREVTDRVEALGCALGKTTVYDNVQAAGKRAQELRVGWQQTRHGSMGATATDVTTRQDRSRSLVISVTASEGGVEISSELPDDADAPVTKGWLRGLAEALGRGVSISVE
ncbi:MAG: hypothetical protein EPO21_06385 [Chloroflexota bacterium]|nr:MAG: hypothetical protein EPO21_06385 [Chloroflexota bacterium]